MDNRFKIRYLPLFEEDLMEITYYITYHLHNPQAAKRLVDDVEKAILERSYYPLSVEPYFSEREHKNNYYRIYVRNFEIYYVVIEDFMEVRRILYNKREKKKLV